MIAGLSFAGGLAAFLASLYLLKIASPRDGVRADFLKSGALSAIFLTAILVLFFGGATGMIWAVTRFF